MARSFLLERQGRSLLFIQPLWLARRWQGASHTFSHPVSQKSLCPNTHFITEEWAQGPGLCRGQRQQELMGKEIEGRRKTDKQVHGTLKVAL